MQIVYFFFSTAVAEDLLRAEKVVKGNKMAKVRLYVESTGRCTYTCLKLHLYRRSSPPNPECTISLLDRVLRSRRSFERAVTILRFVRMMTQGLLAFVWDDTVLGPSGIWYRVFGSLFGSLGSLRSPSCFFACSYSFCKRHGCVVALLFSISLSRNFSCVSSRGSSCSANQNQI